MAFKLKYRVFAKFDEIVLNKKIMLVTALAAPVMFALGTAYLGGFLNNIKIPMFSKKESSLQNASSIVPSDTSPAKNKSIFSDNLNPLYTDAVELKIEAVGIDVNLVELGVTDKGVLEVPDTWGKGGWYKYGAKPGENGNLIINGHYDDNYGKPAAFWQLKNVKVGDKVLVLDKYGKQYTYSVIDSYLVSINDPDRLKVFNDDTNKTELTLVTCGGIWLSGKSTYDKRLVVKAEVMRQAFAVGE